MPRKKFVWQKDCPPPLANGALCLSTPKNNGKSGTEYIVLNVHIYRNIYIRNEGSKQC